VSVPSTPDDRLAGVEAEGLGRHHKWAVLALVAVGTFMTALDACPRSRGRFARRSVGPSSG
jgi:hypothetical protein